MSPSMREDVLSPVRPRGWQRWWKPAASRTHRVFVQEAWLWHRAPGANETARVDDWAAWCAAHAGARVQMVLSGHLTTDLLAPAGLPLRGRAQVAAWARQQWQHYHGPAAQDWPLAAWPHGACALTGRSLAALVVPALAHRVSLMQMRPWWSVAWPAVQRAAPQALPGGSGVLWLLEERRVTRLQLRDGTLAGLEPRWLDEATPEALDRLVHQYPEEAGPQWVIGHGLDPLACQGAAGAPKRQRAVQALGRLVGPVPHARWWGR